MTVREDSRRLLIVNKEIFSSSRYGTRTYHPYRLFFMVNPKPFLFRMVGIKTQINGITLEDKF
jgi:hypothetical protein